MNETVEFWIRGTDLQKLNEKEDHYFVIMIGNTKEDHACYIDTKKVKLTKDLRVSSTIRNEAYIKATYKSLRDELIKFGTEETKE